MKKVCLLVTLAVLAGGCAAKKEKLRTQEQISTGIQALRADSLRHVARIETGGEIRMRIYETTVEKDTGGRAVRETARQYLIERRDSSRKVSARSESKKETVHSQEENQRSTEAESAKKPAGGRFWAGIAVAALAFGGYRLWRLLKK